MKDRFIVRRRLTQAAALASLMLASAPQAQSEPKFQEFAKPDPVPTPAPAPAPEAAPAPAPDAALAPVPDAAPAPAPEAKTAPAQAPEAKTAPAPAPEAKTEPAQPAVTEAAAGESAPAVEWKAQSKGGLVLTSGNSQTTNATFGVTASRKEGNNKLALEGGIAYGKSKTLVVPQDGVSNGIITRLDREERVTTNMWSGKGRYDRFLTDNNSAYASGQIAADKVAGKKLFGGGQAGYSRQLLSDDMNLMVAELGYDFSYESYVQSGLDAVAIHSARVFVGETLKLTPETGIILSVEALLNLNKESKAIDVSDGSTGVNAFKDTRVNGKVAVTTNLRRNLSMGLSLTVKYDQNPAVRPVPAGAPDGAAFAKPYSGNAFADKTDSITEATLIYTFF